jgi:hypothetical protein
MEAQRIGFASVREAAEALDSIGSSNSEMMATRAVHINVMVRNVQGGQARTVKKAYNEVGAEAAVSHDAYYGEEGVVTDMIVMGSVYQHREVRRILKDDPRVRRILDALERVVEEAPEVDDKT